MTKRALLTITIAVVVTNNNKTMRENREFLDNILVLGCCFFFFSSLVVRYVYIQQKQKHLCALKKINKSKKLKKIKYFSLFKNVHKRYSVCFLYSTLSSEKTVINYYLLCS